MCIQQLTPENYHKCGNIWDMAAHQDLAKKWYDQLASGNRIIYVYAGDGEYVGEVSLVIDSGDPDYTLEGRRIYLSRMIVKPGRRNNGIGTRLLHHAVSQAKQMGYAEISVGVDIANIGARWLYEKNGFTTIIRLDEDSAGKYVKLVKHL